MTPSPRALAMVGLGSVSAQGQSREEVDAAYTRGGTHLVPREFGIRSAAVGPLSARAQERIEAFLEEHPRYAELDRTVQLGLSCADRAFRQSEWSPDAEIGVVVGSSRGATGLFERYHMAFLETGAERTAPLTSPTTTLGNVSSWIAQHVGIAGPATEISSTCSTSLYALGTAAAWLRSGMASRFLAGGTEAPLTTFTIAQMRALRVYARDATAPYPCRSCSIETPRVNTMVLGEGACILALEPWTGEQEQKRRSVGVILGLGFSVESVETNTGLSEQGLSLGLSMQRALLDAGLERVDAVVTHTPGTALGDRAELNAVRRVFGDELPVLTSNKWILGHTLGASGALGIEYALFILRHQRWVEYPYPVGVQNEPRPIATVMVNSVGFGGNAGSVVVALAPAT
jgi:3-oxoacyl-[acyl-carrier-protein] synthase II